MAVLRPSGDPGDMNEHTAEPAAIKRLERSRDDRMLAGVCGGLARYFGIHPAFYRVGFVVLTLIGGAGIVIYLAASLVIPDAGKEDSIASAALRDRRDRPWPLIGLGLVAVAAIVLLSRATLWPHGDLAWFLLLLAGIAILQMTRHPLGKDDDRPFPEGVEGDTTVVAGTVATARRRPRRWPRRLWIALSAFVALILIAAAIVVAVVPIHLNRGVGDREIVPATVASLDDKYRLGVGDMELDLRQVQFPPGETAVSVRVDVGDLRVIVPSGVALRATADARWGYVNVLGVTDDGHKADESVDELGTRVLVLDADVGAGSVRITRAVR